MGACLEHHLCRAKGGLGREQCGDVAGQAYVDSGFSEGFDDDVEEGGAGAGETCDCVHVLLVDDDRAADGGEDLLGKSELLVADVAAAADGRGAGTHHCRGVGHGADDGEFAAGCLLDCFGFYGGGEGDQQLAGLERGSDAADNVVQLLRLDSEQDDVSLLRSLQVVGDDRDAKLLAERLCSRFVGHCGNDALRGDEAAAKKRLDQNYRPSYRCRGPQCEDWGWERRCGPYSLWSSCCKAIKGWGGWGG